MKCNQCKRLVHDSFMDKVEHVIKYHPEQVLSRVGHLPDISRTLGERLAEQMKGWFSHDPKRS